MKRTVRTIIMLTVVAIVTAACSSTTGEDDSTPSSTVAPTTTQAVTTTQQTNTTDPSPTSDPDALLDAMNEVMGNEESFLGLGSLTLRDADDAATVHVTADLRGAQSMRGNNVIVSSLDVKLNGVPRNLLWEIREVDGVQYEQNPGSGEWLIDDNESTNPVENMLHGELELADTSADDLGDAFLISGTYPKDSTIESVTIEVDADNFRVRNFTSIARSVRTEFIGLVPAGDADIITIVQWSFSDYGIDAAPTLAPPANTPTVITRFEDDAFQLQIPTAWNEMSEEQLADAVFDADRAWSHDDGFVLLVSSFDLIEDGVGPLTTTEYIDLLVNEATDEGVIDQTSVTTNGQGEEVGFIIGTGIADGNRFINVVAIQFETIAYTVTAIGSPDAFAENIDAIEFALNSLFINT